MNIFKRIGNIFRKAVSIGGAALNSIGVVQWFTRDYANFAKEAYIKNFIAYRCIDLIAQSVSSVPWNVYAKDGDSRVELDQHPLMRTLHRANPSEGWAAFQLSVISYLNIAGASYIERIGPETGPNKGIPFELYTHRPDQIKPILNDEKVLIGHALVVDGKVVKEWMIDPITGQSDLLQIKRFHPLSDLEGLSPIEPGANSIDTSNEALKWNKKLLENEARPGTMFIFNTALGDDQYNRLQKQLQQRVSGAENAGRNLIVEGDMKDAKPFGFNPKEMDFLEGQWDLARQVAITFGVPSMLLGIPGESTYNNFKEAREYFWDTTVMFYLTLLNDEYNNWFFPEDDNTFIDFDLDDVPALAPRRKEKWEMVEKSSTMTINEKREELGQEKVEGGDVLLVPANMIPLDMVGVSEEEVDQSEADMDDLDEDV
jgi:HK97 family phage portal protein